MSKGIFSPLVAALGGIAHDMATASIDVNAVDVIEVSKVTSAWPTNALTSRVREKLSSRRMKRRAH